MRWGPDKGKWVVGSRGGGAGSGTSRGTGWLVAEAGLDRGLLSRQKMGLLTS